MLFIFRVTSNQEAIKATKQIIKGLFLEIRLYQDNLRQSLKSQKQILWTNVIYMKYSVVPMLVMIGPVILILIQLNFRYSNRPPLPGEHVNVKVIADASLTSLDDITLTVDDGLKKETKPLRIDSKSGREIDWRIGAIKEGASQLHFLIGEEKFSYPLPVTSELIRVYPEVMKPNFLDEWLYPGAPFLADDSPIKKIFISYPEKSTPVAGINAHWLITFLIISIVAGYAMKKPFGVEI